MRLTRDHKVTTALISLVVGIAIIVFIARAAVLREIADLWIVSAPLTKPVDAIVVLGGGFDYRPRVAAELYKQGWGREVWITQAKSDDSAPERSVAELTRALLIKLGVPDTAIIKLPGAASSTYEEAMLVSNWLRVTGAKRLIISTDPFHTHRVNWIFNKLAGDKGAQVIVRPIYSPTNSPENWWHSERGRTEFKDEVAKYLYYRLRY